MLVLALYALTQSADSPAVPALRLEEPSRSRFELPSEKGGGKPSTWELVSPAAGEIAIALTSDDFDPVLRWTRAGESGVDVDGGGLLDDAWTTLTVREGERLILEVRSADRRAGEYELRASRDLERPRKRSDVVDVSVGRCRSIAERARAKGEHERAAVFFGRQGALLEREGPYSAAQAAYRESLTSAQQGNDTPRALRTRVRLAWLESVIGDEGNALEELERLDKETAAPELREVRIEVLAILGSIYRERAQIDRALACHDEELKLARAIPSKSAECGALWRIAAARSQRGENDAAEATLAEALELTREPSASSLAGEVWLRHALHYELRGLPRESVQALQRALEQDLSPLARVNVLGTLGNALKELDQPMEARRAYEDSLRIARKLELKCYLPNYVLSFANLEMEFGDYDTAIELLDEAREDRASDARQLERADVLLSLSQAHRFRSEKGDLEAGLAAAREALEIGRRAEDLRVQVGAAILLCQAGDFYAPAPDEARALLEELDEKLSKALDFEGQAKTSGQLAWDDHLHGRWPEAIRRGNSAYEMFAALGEDDHGLEVLDTVALAAIRVRDCEVLARAVERAQLILDRGFQGGASPTEIARMRSQDARFEGHVHDLVALRLAGSGNSAAEIERLKAQGFETAGAWKARSLVESLIRKRRFGTSLQDPELSAALEDLRRRRQRLTANLRAKGDPSVLEGTWNDVIVARRRVEDLERAAHSREGPDLPGLLPRGRPASAVRSRLLDKRTALVEFVAGSELLYAYVLTPSTFEMIPLGPRVPIEAEARAFVGLLASDRPGGEGSTTVRGFAGIAKLGRSLYGSLLAQPLARLSPDVGRLIVIPSVDLAGLPFDALIEGPAPDDAAEPTEFKNLPFVVKRLTIVYGPSAPALLEIDESGRAARETSLLCFADPDYDAPRPAGEKVAQLEPSRGTEDVDLLGDRELPRLEHTRTEATTIAGLIASHGRALDAKDAVALVEIGLGTKQHYLSEAGFELFLGPEATAENLLEKAGRCSTLHIAAHGLRSTGSSSDPLIALSRAGGRTGTITLEQVLNLRMHADLVVLAACDTATGRRVDGDGVHSLARAFLHAGSRSVIASLWEAPDREASEMMRTLYRELLEKERPACEALRESKLALIRDDSARSRGVAVGRDGKRSEGRFASSADPYFWAGFVYLGLPK